jgi:hypothetical protein
MTREVRTGTNFACSNGTTRCYSTGGGTPYFHFTNQEGDDVVYSLNNSRLQRSVNGGQASDLTDPSVTINNMFFYLISTSNTDNQQARVTIEISGTVTYGTKTKSFIVETGATMRGSDI